MKSEVTVYLFTCDICKDTTERSDHNTIPHGWGSLGPTRAKDEELHVCPFCCNLWNTFWTLDVGTRYIQGWRGDEENPWRSLVP
jgi:hypothetical protein